MVINIHIIMSTSAGHWLRCIGGEPIAVACRMHNAAPCLLYRYTYQLHPHFLRPMSLRTRKQQLTLALERVVLLVTHCTFSSSPWTEPHSPHVQAPSSGCPHAACSHTSQQEGCVHTYSKLWKWACVLPHGNISISLKHKNLLKLFPFELLSDLPDRWWGQW